MNTVIGINIKSVQDAEEMARKFVESGKKSVIAASFNSITDLQEEHLKHFDGAPYMWKPMQGNIYGGMLMDDKLNYIHLVLASEEVVNYISKLNEGSVTITNALKSRNRLN